MLSTDTIDNRLERIRELAGQGMNYNEISEDMGLSYSSVYNTARENNITVVRKSKVDKCLPEIERLATEGVRKADIAAKLGLSNSSVSNAMKRHGIEVVQPAKPERLPAEKRLSTARLERLAQVEYLFVKEGLNAAEIARKFNVSREMIRQDLALMDIASSEVNEAQRAKQAELIKELAAEGLVTSEIAEKLEMTAHAVRSIAKKYDIVIQRLKQVEHGTFLSYQRGCTCQPCKDANTASARKQKERRLLKDMPEELHGTDTGYRNWGCQCPRCKEAGMLKNKLSTSSDNPKERNFAIWTPEEDAFVVDYTLTARDLAFKLDRSIPAVNARRATLKKAHPES
jgi:DNA-binding CsgD family transcriptional regulator